MTVPAVLSIDRAVPSGAYTTAASVQYLVTFDQAVSGVSSDSFHVSTSGGLAATPTPSLSGSGSSYTVTVSGLRGSGQLRLDLIDDDSITASGSPLGGVGGGNGSFQGQTYNVDQVAPHVQSILRSSPVAAATGAPTVNFTITFSEPVSGVDPTDFGLALTGTVSATNLVGVFGSGSSYTVTVSGIKGNGSLGLNLVDNRSIRDAAGNGLVPDDGQFSLASQVLYPVGVVPIGTAAGDLNNDQKPDLVVVNFLTHDVSILLGNGDGTFATQTPVATGSNPQSVVVEDLDGDGTLDLAVANFSSNTLSVLLGNGDGTFVAQGAVATSAGPQGVITADFNGDGKPDLAACNSASNSIGIFLGNGDGTFQSQLTNATASSPTAIAAGDLNGDDFVDLVAVYSSSNVATVLLGNGTGSFSVQPSFATGSAPESVLLADFNGDAILDFVVGNTGSNNISVRLGMGDGSFAIGNAYPTGAHPQLLTPADMNGDGNRDIVVANFDDHNVSLLRGAGDGSFAAGVTFATGQNPQFVAVEDFDRDSRRDLAVANFLSGDVSILLGNAVDDFAGQIYSIDAATKLSFVTPPGTTQSGAPLGGVAGLQVAARNAANLVIAEYNATITLTLTGGTFAGGGTTVTAPAINGIATFAGLAIAAPGSCSLSATSDGLTPAASGNFSVTASAAVVNRRIFYRGSSRFDVTNANLPGYSHDNAIAPDKTAYLPGSGGATFANVSSYLQGINGVVFDLLGPHGTITANDFSFRVGNINTPGLWSVATPPSSISVRAGAGLGGSDRIEIIWPDGAIAGEWLQVQVRGNDALGFSNTNTGLASTDVFYFGSAIGDSGAGDLTGFTVNSADVNSARNDPHGPGNPAALTNVNDFNRDGLVNATDQSIATVYTTNPVTQLIVLEVNTPPTANAGGPYLLVAGQSLQLQGTGTDLNPSSVLQFSWDLNGDSVFGDATGATPLVNWSQWNTLGISGPTTINQVRVSVFDGVATTISAPTGLSVVPPSVVLDRKLFYRHSTKWNVTNNNLPGFSDDNAIAPDKSAYLPGSGSTTFANVSSYSRGINGIMIDLAGTHGTVSAADFTFKVGNNNSPNLWSAAPPPTSVFVRPGAGTAGSDRIELVWNDGAIAGQWLQVVARGADALGSGNLNLGLATSDVFYFGSAPGDSGSGDWTNFLVSAADESAARNDPHGPGNPAAITSLTDYNRDGLVNATDQLMSRNAATNPVTALKFLSIASGGPFAPKLDATSLRSAPLIAIEPAAGTMGGSTTTTTNETARHDGNPAAIDHLLAVLAASEAWSELAGLACTFGERTAAELQTRLRTDEPRVAAWTDWLDADEVRRRSRFATLSSKGT